MGGSIKSSIGHENNRLDTQERESDYERIREIKVDGKYPDIVQEFSVTPQS